MQITKHQPKTIMKAINKKDHILDCAQMLIQTRGYNGFSYADISLEVGIRKASIHHYFPTKEQLAVSVIERYRESFSIYLSHIDSEKSWINRISQYAGLYHQVLNENKLCLCGMLASDVETLPPKAKQSIQHFFSDNVTWLVKTLKPGNPNLSDERLQNIAWQIISTLQGAVIVARILDNSDLFSSSYDEMMLQLKHLA